MAMLDDATLRRRYGGQYVAGRDGEVIASDERYERLSEQLESLNLDWDRIVVKYVDLFDVARIYCVCAPASRYPIRTDRRSRDA